MNLFKFDFAEPFLKGRYAFMFDFFTEFTGVLDNSSIKNKFDVLLVHIPQFSARDSENLIVPNGLLWLWSYLNEKGIKTSLINMGTKNSDFIFEKIGEYKPKVIGFSLFSNNRIIVGNLCKKIKNKIPGLKIVLGGPQVTGNIDVLQEKWTFIDKCFSYRAEVDLYKYIKKILNLNVDMSIVDDKKNCIWSMKSPAFYGAIYENIITATGCPGVCLFCSSPYLWKNRICFRESCDIADEIEILYKKGIKRFVFSDDTFTVNFKRLQELFLILKARGIFINWDARTRVDCIDREKLEFFRKNGCSSLSFGIESASTKIIKTINKKIDIKSAAEVIKNASAQGIYTNLFFIIGLPGETDRTIEENIEFVKNTGPNGITSSILHYIPKSGLENRYGAKDWTDLHGPETYYYTDETDLKILIERKTYFESSCNKFLKKRGLEEIEELNKIYPGQPDLLAEAAGLYKSEGNYFKALEYYKESLEILFTPQTAVSRALLLKDSNKKSCDLAKKLINRACKKLGLLIKNGIRTNETSFYLRCLCYIEKGNFKKALTDIRACLDFDSANISSIEMAAWICMEMEKDSLALEFLDMIPKQERTELWYYNSIICSYNLGKIKEAKRMIRFAKQSWKDSEFFKDF